MWLALWFSKRVVICTITYGNKTGRFPRLYTQFQAIVLLNDFLEIMNYNCYLKPRF